MFEEASLHEMPEKLKYHGAARYRLKSMSFSLKACDGKKERFAMAAEHLESHVLLDLPALKARLEKSCQRHGKEHTCLDPFRQNLPAVRNWLVLWRSLSPAMRREAMLVLYKKAFAAHAAGGGLGSCKTQYTVMGLPVCALAFQIITGVSSSTMEKMRQAASKGQHSSLSRGELPFKYSLDGKPALYLDARVWLEQHACTFGDFSPMSGECWLPCGRKFMYFVS